MFAIVVIAGLCFCLGILYPIIGCAIYKLLGGKKPIREYIRTL
jgi:hypothetical protein